VKKTSRAPLAASAIAIAAAASALATGLAWAAPAGSHASVVPPVPTPTASPSCSSLYTEPPPSWDTGFVGSLTVTSNGTTPITGWTVTYSYTGNETLAGGWSGNWTQSGEDVTVTNASWNGSLAPGASTSLGATFDVSGPHAAPTHLFCVAHVDEPIVSAG
jgi:cellulase/cellobiase CelA1